MRGFDARIISMGRYVVFEETSNSWMNRSVWAMNIRHWMVAVMLAIGPAVRARRWIKERRKRRMMATDVDEMKNRLSVRMRKET